jgi:chromosome segregation ATPase
MSITPQVPREPAGSPTAAAGGGTPRWLLAVLAVLVLLLVYNIYAVHSARNHLSEKLEQASARVAKLEARAGALEDNYAGLKGQFDVTTERLGLTQAELARARALASQVREEQRRTAEQLGSQLAEQDKELDSLTGEVGAVRSDVAATRDQLQATAMKLERTIGDLGVQSGLIARNSSELEELKRRGERDYFEFDVKKSKQYVRIGQVSMRLNRTDTKRQKFTLTLLVNDKVVEKKDKTLLEPVQFYVQGTRHLLELVVYEIKKDQVVGYLSAPKEVALR